MRFTEHRVDYSNCYIYGVEFRNVKGKYCRLQCCVGKKAMIESPTIIQLVKDELLKRAEYKIRESEKVKDGDEEMVTNVSSAVGSRYFSPTLGRVTGVSSDDSTVYVDTTSSYDFEGIYDKVDILERVNISPRVLSPQEIKIKYMDGLRELIIRKKLTGYDVEITEEDIQKARAEWWKEARVQVVARKAERKAEDLLKMFISDIDFRNYKEKGYFMVKSGDRIFRIHKDTHEWIDVWKKERFRRGVYLPENRLCVHTPKRDIAVADEALAKLMLVRSGRAIKDSNIHGIGCLSSIKERDLIKDGELVLV